MANADSTTPLTGADFSHPKFVWRFYLPRFCRMKYVIAHTEAEARKKLRNPAYIFSARFLITEGVYQLIATRTLTTGEVETFTLPDMLTSRERAERYASEWAYTSSFPGRTGTVTFDVVEVRHA